MQPVTSTAADRIDRLRDVVGSIVLGKPDVIETALVALLGHGHVLIEDVPGVGKTLLARTLARSIACSFRRIQFTPDLLPSDILGSNVYNGQSGEFVFKPGPLFANVVLADEINRTSPRTQSALLEAMNDGQVSMDGEPYPLPQPFLVMATQNPFEFEGTYALPESQLDRFMLRLRIGHPDRDQERRILAEHRMGEPIDGLEPVVSVQDVLELQRIVRSVEVEESVADYLLDIAKATRESDELYIGVSTRGALMLYRAAQARALLHGRDFVVPDDVKQMAVPVLAHRVVCKSVSRRASSEGGLLVVSKILQSIPVPE
jgi:MoxR-like ATPase